MQIKLKELRKKESLSLNKLKQILKDKYDISVSDSQLMYYENETRKPRDKKIWSALADYFEVDEAYLLGYSNYRNPFEQLLDTKGTDLGYGITGFSQTDLNQISCEDSFINFLKKYDFDLSNDDIDKILDLVQSLSDTNKKMLNNLVETGDIKKLEELKNGNFSSLFTYNSKWSDKINNPKE